MYGNGPIIVRGSSSFVINADSGIVKVQGFIFYVLHTHIQNFSSSSKAVNLFPPNRTANPSNVR